MVRFKFSHLRSILNKLSKLLLIVFSIFLISCNSEKKPPRVIVLGLDGMMSDGIENAYTPNIHSFISEGTSTMNARAVYPTSSGANWASMILGSGPDQHGVDNNGWTLKNRKVIPVFEKSNGYSPSIFDVLKNKYPNLRMSAVFNWIPIANYFDTSIPDTVIEVKSTEEAIDKILTEIIDEDTHFVFSQIDHMDHAGHSSGFGSENYYREAEILDQEIGRLIETLKTNKLYDETYIIVISDHGGKGTGHGNKSMAEYTVPFIIRGPGIEQNKTTIETVSPFDIAATVANIFNCDIPECWIGSNVTTAFGNKPSLVHEFIPKPTIIIDSINKYYSFVRCVLQNSDKEVLYQIIPPSDSSAWKTYTKQLKIPHGNKIRASVFYEGKPSRITEFEKLTIKHLANDAEVSLVNMPNKKYQALGEQSLTDGLIANSTSFTESEWMGLFGDDLIATIDLRNQKKINSIKFRFLENINSWIFLPQEIKLYSSVNGKRFKHIKTVKDPFKINIEEAAIVDLEITFKEINTRYLKVVVENYGKLPEWHSGAGSNSWVFVDEIIVN